MNIDNIINDLNKLLAEIDDNGAYWDCISQYKAIKECINSLKDLKEGNI